LKKILFISYDGLTDPLGQSQILPYLKGLSIYGYQFTILSFEKKDRFANEKEVINKLTRESDIDWVPLSFTSKPPLLSKFYDAVQMRRKAESLHKQKGFDMVHCRSYIAADVGLYLKKKFGVRFFFDMRGFWADEKRDGSWNLKNPIFKRVYQYYKGKEQQYLKHADQIISLTEAGKREMMTWQGFENDKLQVIPCCADTVHFSVTSNEQRSEGRKKFNIDEDALVLSYLGSVGTWYMLDEMLAFFKKLKEAYAHARFLFVTHSSQEMIIQKIRAAGLDEQDFLIMQASRKEVPVIIKASDVNISFIKPVYSKISSSPTKLGEVLSMGIPVICNSGVGDVKEIVESTDAGVVIDDFNDEEYQKAIDAIPNLLQKSPERIREASKKIYDLEQGIALYLKSYQKVL
jgi:glycosyltransferase involved in cell wall biosynthesis